MKEIGVIEKEKKKEKRKKSRNKFHYVLGQELYVVCFYFYFYC